MAHGHDMYVCMYVCLFVHWWLLGHRRLSPGAVSAHCLRLYVMSGYVCLLREHAALCATQIHTYVGYGIVLSKSVSWFLVVVMMMVVVMSPEKYW
jgi:hypothetical protein